MFTGHVSLHLRWNSCPKTQRVHPLDCNNLPCAGLYIVAGNQLRPCGQRRPDSWVNLSLFISVTRAEARRARSSLSPVTEREHCEPHRWSHLQDLSQSLILTHSSSDRQDVVQTQFLTSPQLRCSGPCNPLFTFFRTKSSRQRSCLEGSASEHTARAVRPCNICDSHINLCVDSSNNMWVIISKADAMGKAISRRKWKIKVQTSCFSFIHRHNLVMPECCAMPAMLTEREAGLSWATRLMASLNLVTLLYSLWQII